MGIEDTLTHLLLQHLYIFYFIFGVYNLNINKDIKQKRQTVVKLSIFKPEPLVKKEIPKKLNIPAPVPVIKNQKLKERGV